MSKKSITWEEYPKLIEQIKTAVIKDLNSLDPNTSILRVRTWCRDEEDRIDLCCYYDFSPDMDGIYRRFNPDVIEFIKNEYEGLIRWYDQSDKNVVEYSKIYYSNEYSTEQIYKKFYVTVTKYVEIANEMTILYSADFSLKGEVISIDDPTGHYTDFNYSEDGYFLSDAEKIISDNIHLFWHASVTNLPYQTGDILYIDGSPYQRPFYAVHCGDKFLYISNIEQYNIARKYNMPRGRYLFPFIELKYGTLRWAPLFYKIQIVSDCDYKCLVEASRLLKEYGQGCFDVKEKVQPIFEEEFKDNLVPARSTTRMKDICKKFSIMADNYPDVSFTEFFDNFAEWLRVIKTISIFDLDDNEFLNLLTEYFEGDCEQQDEKSKKFQKMREDRDCDWNTVHF